MFIEKTEEQKSNDKIAEYNDSDLHSYKFYLDRFNSHKRSLRDWIDESKKC